MLGIEIRESAVVALDVDDQGQVRARAEAPLQDDGAAVLIAVDRVVPGALQPHTAVGVAALAPASEACRAAVAALATRHAGRFVADGPLASGAAAALAENWVGAARGATDVVLLSVGDHVTAGIVRRGEPFTGAHGCAASAAWLSLNPVDREDYRRTGCLEAEAATAGIVRRLVWRVKAGDASDAVDLAGGDLASVAVEHVLAAARAGDGVAISVVRDTAKYLGMAAANLVAVADPHVIVLGGIVADAPDLLLEPIRAEMARRLPPSMRQSLEVVPASLGADAAAIGAARFGAAAAS